MSYSSQFKITAKDWENATTDDGKDENKPVVDGFEALKRQMEVIDQKYSPTVKVNTVEMPRSLGLQKKDYTAPTEDEIYETARQSLLSGYLSKQQSLKDSSAKNESGISDKMTATEYSNQTALAQLARALSAQLEQIQQSATARGVGRGSIADSEAKETVGDYDVKKADATADADDKLSRLKDQLQALAERTQAALEALQSSHEAEVTAKANSLSEDSRVKQEETDKYNNSVDEKESKYQKAVAEAQNKAANDEVSRAAKIVNMYSQIGKSGVEEMAAQEKLAAAKKYFSSMSKEQALETISRDSSMRNYLGSYYDFLVEFIKAK